jgi:hypothetical protein
VSLAQSYISRNSIRARCTLPSTVQVLQWRWQLVALTPRRPIQDLLGDELVKAPGNSCRIIHPPNGRRGLATTEARRPQVAHRKSRRDFGRQICRSAGAEPAILRFPPGERRQSRAYMCTSTANRRACRCAAVDRDPAGFDVPHLGSSPVRQAIKSAFL